MCTKLEGQGEGDGDRDAEEERRGERGSERESSRGRESGRRTGRDLGLGVIDTGDVVKRERGVQSDFVALLPHIDPSSALMFVEQP